MRTFVLGLAVCLVGCQTQGYQQYADAMARIAESQASVAREQTAAMMRLAEFGGDQTTRTVAVIMLAMGAQSSRAQVQVAPPQNEALEWARALAPSVTAGILGLWAYKANKHAVDAASETTIAGYGAMQGIAQSGFNAVGQFKPQPIDWGAIGSLRPNDITTTTISNQGNGAIGIGGGTVSVDNRINPAPEPVPVVPGFGPL